VELRSKHSFLASYLLQERRTKNSFWQPYIRILPERYANMPLFFDEEKLSWLAGSFSLGKISERIDSLKREYDAIRQMVPEFQVYAFDEFVWARLVVITRIFGLVIEGNKTDGLVPYADMLNHKRPRETKWNFDDSRYGFIITSLRTIQRGEEVYDSYGRKCNSRFFVNYGFALDENEDNEAILRVQLPRNDPHFAMKLRFLGGREIAAKREFQIPADYKEKKCKELFSFLRFVHAKDSELLLLSSADGFKLDDIEPISVRNEIKTLEDIRAAAELTLRGFPDSLENDDKLLEGKVGDPNLRNCAVQRRGEKQVLKWFIDVATQAVPFLNLPWKDLKRVAAKCYQGTSRLDFYVTSVVVPLVKKVS
jgi:histone-lysine N-methyltransferase SETD3